MSTKNQWKREEISCNNPSFSRFRTMIETAFYGNHVTELQSVEEAYREALEATGTIITDLTVYEPDFFDLPEGTRVLVDNGGAVTGRTAFARRILGEPGTDDEQLIQVVQEAIYQKKATDFWKTSVVVGLDSDFMVKSHLMIPKGEENNLYSYVLNFQFLNKEYRLDYEASKAYEEGDIYIYADPSFTHPDYPHGLVVFDETHNACAVLGLNYFGELKKATLTLAWALAKRNGYVPCHGGLKQFKLGEDEYYTMAVFGLSGSGKSTITLADHDHRYQVAVLHDDAFIISKENGSSISLEPAYFDKTQDYPMSDPGCRYFLTVQNVGVTLDEEGKRVLVTEDLRNGNGRTVKSLFATPNRVYSVATPLDSIFWIMKEPTLPPILKVTDPALATLFGLTLMTKRTTAEHRVQKTKADQVIEPFANPFRIYPLGEEYQAFYELFQSQDIACYILNTDYFGDKKVTKEDTLQVIEQVVENQAEFVPFGSVQSVEYLPTPGFDVNWTEEYAQQFKESMEVRLRYLERLQHADNGYHQIPEVAVKRWRELVATLS